MRKTFVCDDSMIITIPIGRRTHGRGHVMPREFQCVYRDTFKVFAIRGFPKPLGAAQCLTGLWLVILGLIFHQTGSVFHIFPNILFLLCGMLTFAAGHVPNMRVIKVSLCLNIVGFFWSVVAVCLSVTDYHLSQHFNKLHVAVKVTTVSLLVVENLTALFLIYRQSKAVCRQHFNTLPIIQLKHED
uniref:uncharacterized protein LOC131137039 isoform X1 n=1 Tax=Doryrhamphus excisus TaxID=161450 RepID=UPI0025AE6FF2|nr:uncharacterized protein LOC131137039 isoform X1 [Doryrhamphus excisus]XP_057940513.1 uncharacterized protein LOC131137039 isoform X1 [Doryrhamphus excisus]XP_057940515.1 uncharacterized protein LOC131137039 isoform X1 [Doryrhamphus excisus]XP_057940516.1 uncharacterized protein LOC131137039 isoform X1 [Doryrhamphus excisus]